MKRTSSSGKISSRKPALYISSVRLFTEVWPNSPTGRMQTSHFQWRLVHRLSLGRDIVNVNLRKRNLISNNKEEMAFGLLSIQGSRAYWDGSGHQGMRRPTLFLPGATSPRKGLWFWWQTHLGSNSALWLTRSEVLGECWSQSELSSSVKWDPLS